MDTGEPNYVAYVAPVPCAIGCQQRYKKLCEDEPGWHTYVWACVCCQREYGPEWAEYHATAVGIR